ncbi:MAG: endonuclease/exonuclease/phosphatase family protein [Bacteroidetes bacterium]|nr:endonuclease/exonuclease/phosphatase family protein [Bacteroidota bacterium]
MPAFPKPDTLIKVDALKEIKNLNDYKNKKTGRFIPKSISDNLLIATWNIANLGVQKRETGHYKIISEIISWFDVIALQEVNDNTEGLMKLLKQLDKKFKYIFTDPSGNNERMAIIYNSQKLKLLEKIGEIAIAAEDLKNITLPNFTYEFKGFSRSPFLTTFKTKKFVFALINVHLYFGDENESISIQRRSLETYAIARWADLRRKSKYAFTQNILALGDFNMPKVEKGDPVYDALISRGFEMPEHTSKIFSNISNDKNYDQIAFMPGMKKMILSGGVFDFDGAIFTELWDENKPLILRNYLRYYISDHRPRWYELHI